MDGGGNCTLTLEEEQFTSMSVLGLARDKWFD